MHSFEVHSNESACRKRPVLGWNKSTTTTNLFGNPNTITNRKKLDISVNVLTNVGSRMVDEGGEIPISGPKNSHPEMIANVLILNETTKNTK